MHVRRKNPLFNDTVQVCVELYQSFDSAQSNYVSASGLLGTNKGTIRTKRKRTTQSEEAKRKLESTFLFGLLRLWSHSKGYRYLRDLELSARLSAHTRILVKNLPIIRNFVLKGFRIFGTGINNKCVALNSYEFGYNKLKLI